MTSETLDQKLAMLIGVGLTGFVFTYLVSLGVQNARQPTEQLDNVTVNEISCEYDPGNMQSVGQTYCTLSLHDETKVVFSGIGNSKSLRRTFKEGDIVDLEVSAAVNVLGEQTGYFRGKSYDIVERRQMNDL